MKKLSLILSLVIFCTAILASCGTSAYTPGTLTETGYSSDWLGLEFVPAENMVMASAAELEEMMNLTGEEKQNLDWSQVIEAYEMMASDPVNGDSVVVMAEKLYDKSTTVGDFIENLKEEISALSELGITYGEGGTVTIGGEKYTRFEYGISFGGMTISQTSFLRKLDDRMVVITITSSSEDAQEMFLSCFKAK